ncbi:hypothetical protein JYT83_00025 [bacterium AH-315-F18]|nr:hypothetical protein [bacterium AH-315-F18]
MDIDDLMGDVSQERFKAILMLPEENLMRRAIITHYQVNEDWQSALHTGSELEEMFPVSNKAAAKCFEGPSGKGGYMDFEQVFYLACNLADLFGLWCGEDQSDDERCNTEEEWEEELALLLDLARSGLEHATVRKLSEAKRFGEEILAGLELVEVAMGS